MAYVGTEVWLINKGMCAIQQRVGLRKADIALWTAESELHTVEQCIVVGELRSDTQKLRPCG